MADQSAAGRPVEPLFNIKAVVQQTGVPADTVRAWERRYGLPLPERTPTGRRLYSADDIAAIRWLRERTAGGLTISQAIQQYQSLGTTAPAPLTPVVAEKQTTPIATNDLLPALLAFDESQANILINQAFALYQVEDVCLQILHPALRAIGEQWLRGEALIAQEHFATHLIQRRLHALLAAYTPTVSRGRIVIACTAEEQHEIGILILSVFLVRRGWQVIYLGANVPQSDIVQVCVRLQPLLLCLSATNQHTAQSLIATAAAVAALPGQSPLIGFGGAPFNQHSSLRAQVKGHFLGLDAQEAVTKIETLLS